MGGDLDWKPTDVHEVDERDSDVDLEKVRTLEEADDEMDVRR